MRRGWSPKYFLKSPGAFPIISREHRKRKGIARLGLNPLRGFRVRSTLMYYASVIFSPLTPPGLRPCREFAARNPRGSPNSLSTHTHTRTRMSPCATPPRLCRDEWLLDGLCALGTAPRDCAGLCYANALLGTRPGRRPRAFATQPAVRRPSPGPGPAPRRRSAVTAPTPRRFG